jgi:DNA gyrase subunit B
VVASVGREAVLTHKTGELTGDDLVALVRKVNHAVRMRQHLDKRGDGRILALFAEEGLTADDLRDRAKLERIEARVTGELGRRHPEMAAIEFDYQADGEHGGFFLRVPPGLFSVRRETFVNTELVRSSEFAELRRITEELRKAAPAPVALRHDDGEPRPIASFDELAVMVEEIGRKGLQIQRYKGLGEMNAEQLWETTMDPTKRNLLRVKVEEMEEADRIFTKLMGDLVEPRREFIEENALNVRNLDV